MSLKTQRGTAQSDLLTEPLGKSFGNDFNPLGNKWEIPKRNSGRHAKEQENPRHRFADQLSALSLSTHQPGEQRSHGSAKESAATDSNTTSLAIAIRPGPDKACETGTAGFARQPSR